MIKPKCYGSTDPTLTYSITGFQGTDTEADLDTGVSISRAVGEDVGTYTITPSAAADSNYNGKFCNRRLYNHSRSVNRNGK